MRGHVSKARSSAEAGCCGGGGELLRTGERGGSGCAETEDLRLGKNPRRSQRSPPSSGEEGSDKRDLFIAEMSSMQFWLCVSCSFIHRLMRAWFSIICCSVVITIISCLLGPLSTTAAPALPGVCPTLDSRRT